MTWIPFVFAAMVGFNHAFEADHVLAVGNIANKRPSIWMAIKDGIFWGLGHTSMIFLVGIFIIIGKLFLLEEVEFEFFEVFVGISMVGLGLYRLVKYQKTHDHSHTPKDANFRVAYSVGLIHGLAGSGTVILLAMSEIKSNVEGIFYLLIFGIGSILGMMVVAGVFTLPYLKSIQSGGAFHKVLVWISAGLCLSYGVWMIVSYFQ
ncbi:MAG: urease accessory protein [Rickettsiales bacterium]|nr:urease accessory protein [Rickettsiales bacterium]